MGSAPQTPPTATATAEDEETGTDVDVHVDQPSLITSSVETTAPAVGGPPVLPADGEGQTLRQPSSARMAAAALAAAGAPPPAPPPLATVVSEGQARGRMDSLAEITTAHGLSAGPPVSIRNAVQQGAAAQSRDDESYDDDDDSEAERPTQQSSLERAIASAIDNDSSVSLITPRFEANALVSAELAFADTALGDKKGGLFDNELPAASEPDTMELGTIQKPTNITALPKQATMRTATARDIGEDPTLQRDPEPPPPNAPAAGLATEADEDDSTLDARDFEDPPTLDPPLGPNPEDDRTRPRALQGPLIAHLPPEKGGSPLAASTEKLEPGQSAGPNIADLPPMRPKLDSEAAGHWPPWHAQSAEAKAAVRNVISSPVASGTEAIPKSVIREAIDAVDSKKAVSLAAATDELLRASAEPPFSPKQTQPMPMAPVPVPVPVPPGTPRERKSRLPYIAAPEQRPGSASDATPSGRSASGRRDDKSSVSPVTVFIVTFLLVGSVLGGLIAAQQFGWFGVFASSSSSSSKAPDPGASAATTTPPSASATTTTTSPADSASAAAAASASASASSKSPKTKPSAAPSSSSGHRRRH